MGRGAAYDRWRPVSAVRCHCPAHVCGGAEGLVFEAAARDFVADAFQRCKFIGYDQSAMPLLTKAGIANSLESASVCLPQSARQISGAEQVDEDRPSLRTQFWKQLGSSEWPATGVADRLIRNRWLAVRSDHNFHAAVLFVSESLVGLWPVFKAHSMCDQEGRINFAFDNQVHQWLEVALYVRLASLEG